MSKFRLRLWRRQNGNQPQQELKPVEAKPVEVKPAEALPKGYFPINQTRPEDVFIVGFPKSGNTWFQNLIGAVAYGVNPVWSPVPLVHELVPDVHSSTIYRRFSTPSYFKSHHLPQPEYRRVVYLLRDGRDAMVSYWHYREAMEKKKLDFLEFVKDGQKMFPCRWHEHVNAWMKNPHGAEMIVIKYEDLLTDAVEQLRRFCQFIGLERDAAFLKAAAESSDFRNLRRKEEKAGFGRADHKFEKGSYFFRRGVAGSHKDEMPAEVLAAFMSDARDTMKAMGYDVEDAVADEVAK